MFSWVAMLAVLLLPAQEAGGAAGPWIEGPIELDRVAAISGAKTLAVRVLEERYLPLWEREAGPFLPSPRLRAHMERWLALHGLRKITEPLPLEVFETSVGRAFRRIYRLRVEGREERSFLFDSFGEIRRLRGRYENRWIGFSVFLGVVLLLGIWLDRSTRGFLTGKILLGGFLLSGAGLWLLMSS